MKGIFIKLITAFAICVMVCACVLGCGKSDSAGEKSSETPKKEEKPGLGLEYALSSDGEYYIVKGYGECEKTELTIPDTYENKPVKAIGKNAFKGCTEISKVVIPSGISSIGAGAFEGCANLKAATVAGEITSVEERTFKGCTSLKEFSVPSSVTTIGYNAFDNCESLSNISLPSGLTRLGYGAFINCINLSSIKIPDTVATIEYNTFNGCYKLARIEIGAGVTEIQDYAFENCHSLVEIENKSSYIYVAKGDVGNGGIGLNALNVGNNDESFVSRMSFDTENGFAIYTGNIDQILLSYNGNKRLVEIPYGVTVIHKYAFYRSKELMKVTISNSVLEIGEEAFYECSSLLAVDVGTRLSSVGRRAFLKCIKLVEIVNRSSYDFESNKSDSGLFYTSKYLTVFDGDEDAKHRLKLMDGGFIVKVTTRTTVLVGYVGNDANLIIPNYVNRIHSYAFYNNTQIKSIWVGEYMGYFEDSAFEGCTNLQRVTIEYDQLRASTGYDMPVITLAGLFYIGERCFAGCESLKQIIIPEVVKQIEDDAFAECDDINVYFELSLNPTKYNGGYSNDLGCPPKRTHWHSSVQPSESGTGKWRYVNGKPTVWE